MAHIYICIPVFNRLKYTIKCIESICSQSYPHYTIVICDDGSSDGTKEHIALHYPEVVILNGNGNLWWTGATNMCVNYALRHAQDSDYVFTLNNDTELENHTLAMLVEFAQKTGNGIIGAVNVFFTEPHRIEPSAFKKSGDSFFKKIPQRVNKWGEDLSSHPEFLQVDALSGKGVLIPVRVFKKVGLYNFKKLPHYHADTEFTLRAARAGISIFILYTAKVLSHQDLSGIGTQTSSPNVSEFIKSFKSLKSANHFTTLKNYCSEIYGRLGFLYLAVYIGKSVFGFTRRLLLSKFS